MRKRKGSILLIVMIVLSALGLLILGSVSPIFLLRKEMNMVEERHDKAFKRIFDSNEKPPQTGSVEKGEDDT